MTTWTAQINKHKVVLPSGITVATNGKIAAELLSPVYRGDGKRFGFLSIPAARSFNAMVRDAKRDGVPASSINCTDAFRSYAEQERIFRERYTTTPTKYNDGRYHTKSWLGKTWYQKPNTAAAAVPGTSNHGYAVAIDKGDGNVFHAWLEVNAYKYGWEWELASEKWHLHYWPGDDIPEAVLDSEAGMNEEDDFMANLDENEKKSVLETIGGLAYLFGMPVPDGVPGELVRNLRQAASAAVHTSQNGMLDWGAKGGDLNGFGITEKGAALQVYYVDGQAHKKVLISEGQAVKTFSGPALDLDTGTVVNWQVELENGKIRWLTFDSGRPNFPNEVVDEAGHPLAGYHVVPDSGGWHYFDI